MHFRFRRSVRTITRQELFRNDKHWVVFWHKGFLPNTSLKNQPRVAIEFRQLGRNGEILPIYEEITVLVSDLSFFSIGSVWHNGICVKESDLQEKEFDLDYGGGWRFQNVHDSSVFPTELYKPDKHHLPESWAIEFDLENGGKLLIPCIEFFSRCYGFSGEVKRVLTTYPWDECLNRLYASNELPEEPGKWQIRLPALIPESDAIMLASARYRPETQRALSSIYSGLSTQFFNHRTSGKKIQWPVPLKIGPWHKASAILIAEGMPFGTDGKSFLGLRITGFSEPEGPAIKISRQQGDKAEIPAPQGSDAAFDGARITTRIQIPESVVVTGYTDPDSGMERVEAETPSLKIVGKRRALIKVISAQARYTSGNAVPGKDASSFSPGRAEKNDQAIGELSVQTRGISVMDSEGVVRDFWQALLALQCARPDLIQSVEWYTPGSGFSGSTLPEYIAFDAGYPNLTTHHKWCFTDSAQTMKRGVLFIRIRLPGRTVYIVEIERRPPRNTEEKESEAFRGLIIEPDVHIDVDEWLKNFMPLARFYEGLVIKFLDDIRKPAYIFKHPSSKNSPYPGFPAVRNAFDKIGVELSMKTLG